MSTPLKNIIIAGATGSVGAPILKALLAEPAFNVTILTRASSSAKFPPNIPVMTVSDEYTVAELTTAFRGQDAVLVALSTIPVTQEGSDSKESGLAYRLIDAALAAGVKRFIPSEYGANNLDPRARAAVPTYDVKGANLSYLIKKAEESNGSFTWTSISCGSWLDWALDPTKSGNFLGVDVKRRSATIWDSGDAKFSVTTSGNTGTAVAKLLLQAEESANKQVFLSDFVTSVNEVVRALEKATGEKFSVTRRESGPEIERLWKEFRGGDAGAAFGLLALSFVADWEVGYDFEKEQKIWNERLGLEKMGLEEVIADVVRREG